MAHARVRHRPEYRYAAIGDVRDDLGSSGPGSKANHHLALKGREAAPYSTEHNCAGAFRLLYNRPLKAERVFLSEDGQSLVGYKHWFKPAVEKAGVKNFTWYCLRHTFASRLAMAGVDLRTIADLMGHASIQMTMRYAHLAPSHKLSAVEKLMTAPTDTTTDTEVILESDAPAEVVLLQ